jgi:quinoprotein relay system zinc metallohydrolase 2
MFCLCCGPLLSRRKLIAAAGAFLATGAASPEPWPMSEVADGVFVRRGALADLDPSNADAIANIGFIIGRDGVAVIDPGGSHVDGLRLLAAIRARTERPILYVIETHVHLDHCFGGSAFRESGARVVGHPELPRALAERGEFYRKRLVDFLGPEAAGAPLPPDLLVEETLRLDLGDRSLTVTAHRPAHTDTDLTLFDEKTATLWAGDLLFLERLPVLDGSLRGWLAELEKLKAQRAARAIPGHGPSSVAWPEGAADEERYLRTLLREVQAAMARGEDIAAASESVATGEKSKWRLFEEFNGRNVIEAYKELEWE